VTPLEWYVVVVVHLGAVPATIFPLAYSRSPWRSTDVGKALMLKGTSVALLFDVPIVGFYWPFPGYDVIYAAIVTLVVIGVTYQCAVMLRIQRQGRHYATPDGEF
jgi:predicted MFS family arabinose efflux permease